MALAPFFERIYSALGGHLAVSRDDLSTALQGVTVGVACGDHVSDNDSWIGELSTNLLARLYPRIAITGAEQQAASLRNLALNINPEVEIVAEAPESLTIGIGKGTSSAALFPSANGWVAKLGYSQNEGGPPNPYSAGAAATFAAAEVFRRIFLKSVSSDDVSVSLLNFDKTCGAELDLPSSNLGDVLFVAVGAVGNAAIWALARDARRHGHFILIDNEQLELSNLQRYVLASYKDISRQKVLLGREVLNSSRIAVETVTETLESFSEMNGGIRTPTLCISVDNIASRRAAQALLPKLVINGWTGDRALGVSWHVFSREAACLACLYQPHGEGVSQTEQAARALGLTAERAALLWVTEIWGQTGRFLHRELGREYVPSVPKFSAL